MKVAVTGGAGFVGNYIMKRLISEGHSATALDIVFEDQNTNSIKVDVTDPSQVRNAFAEINPDVVIHLAALAGSKGKGGGAESLKFPYEYFDVNVNGTLNVFEACRELGIQRVLCMSSFSPYGQAPCPINEKTPFSPNNPYGGSKACVEEIAKCYSVTYGIKTIIFRPPLICGEGQNEMNALREFAHAALNDEPIVILGEGKHVREFVHPEDVAGAFSLAMDYVSEMETSNDIFVLGSEPIRMCDLAQLVVNEIGKGSIVFRPATKQVFDQFTDHKKISQILGWRPTIDVRQIVRRVVADMKIRSFVRSEAFGTSGASFATIKAMRE